MERRPTIILLIEDDEDDYILLQKILTKIPGGRYTVIWEHSPLSGLNAMLTQEHDLCMLDYRLGASNGIELLKEARSQGYENPIILLTGANEGEIDIQALQAGADDYISKEQLQGELLYRIIRYAIERRKAERDREHLLREQLASRELEQRRNEFIGMVVHELKTPLTSLKGYAYLLRKRHAKAADEQAVQLSLRMEQQITKLTDLVDDFLDVSRLAGGMLQFHESYFDFDALVTEIVQEVQLVSEQQVIQSEGKTGQQVWGDRMRVGQVITNFLTNAMKYAPQSKYILLKTQASDTDVILSVKDFGPGIPKELRKKIFDPFYRIEKTEMRETPGLGLGLHIASEIIKRQDGQIWVESEEGQGATFYFTLPLERKPATKAQEGVQTL